MSWNKPPRSKIEELDLTEPTRYDDNWEEAHQQRQQSNWRQPQYGFSDRQQERKYYSNQGQQPQYGYSNQEQQPQYGYSNQEQQPQYENSNQGQQPQYGYDQQQPPPGGYPGRQPQAQHPYGGQPGQRNMASNDLFASVTKEDIEVLSRCNSQALYGRSLPLMGIFNLGLFLLKQRGMFNIRMYHYFGANVVGFALGKISFRSKCEDMIISSNSKSPFANSIRKRRGIIVEELDQQNPINQMDNLTMESDWTTPNQGDGPYQSSDNPSEQPRHYNRPLSYDDLRAQNRRNYKTE